MFVVRTGRIVFNAPDLSGGGNPPPAPAAPAPTEHPVTAPWNGVEGVWNLGEGEAAKPWWNTLPDEAARKHVEAKQYANPNELALANYNLTRLQTGDPAVLSLPAADAPKEQWDAFYTKMGRPESADKYELNFGEGVKTDDNMVKFGKDLFFEMGLDGKRAQAAADKWNSFVAEQNAAAIEADRVANDTELSELTTRWGADLEQNKAAGKRVVEALGLSTEFINRLENNIGSAPVVELLAMIGRKSDEGGFTGGVQMDPNNPATMNKEQAQNRITQLQSDAAFMAQYMDSKHPSHQEALSLMERLFART